MYMTFWGRKWRINLQSISVLESPITSVVQPGKASQAGPLWSSSTYSQEAPDPADEGGAAVTRAAIAWCCTLWKTGESHKLSFSLFLQLTRVSFKLKISFFSSKIKQTGETEKKIYKAFLNIFPRADLFFSVFLASSLHHWKDFLPLFLFFYPL